MHALRPDDPAADEPIVRLGHVSKVYDVGSPAGGGAPDREGKLEVVHNVSLAIRPREFVSIIGPSGCGKTTLLFMLAGLRAATGGTVEVCGRTPTEAVRAGLSSVIFQQPVLFEWLTAEENVLLPLRMRDPRWWAWPLRRRAYRDRARAALALVELEGFEHYYPDRLSGGMQQRVAIARALTLDPQVLLLDEPFGALDELTRDRMNLELIRLCEDRSLTVVFVTHSIEEATFLSDRVVVMGRGPSPQTDSSFVRVIDVGLPRPRRLSLKEEAAFFEKVKEGREALRTAQGVPG